MSKNIYIKLACLVVVMVGSTTSGTSIYAATGSYISAEQYATSTSCSPALSSVRDAVDLQNDLWAQDNTLNGDDLVSTIDIPIPMDPDRVNSHPTRMLFNDYFVNGSQLGVDVSLRDVSFNTLPAPYAGSVGDTSQGALNVGTTFRNPYTPIPASGTLQDCAPYPQSLYDTDLTTVGDQYARQWNAVTGEASTLDGVLFTFDVPLTNFGAWFGDLETRPETPAYLKLFDVNGNVVHEEFIQTSTISPSDTNCGGSSQSTDNVGCGNQATRWVGFITDQSNLVKSMLVVVGDDDSCTQVSASLCDGSSEHLSWVGGTTMFSNSLGITKSSSLEEVKMGDQFNYIISVNNSGSSDVTSTITVADTLPNELELIQASGTDWVCDSAQPTITCTTDNNLLVGARLSEITIVVKVKDGAIANSTLVNNAKVSWSGKEVATTDDVIVVSTPVEEEAPLVAPQDDSNQELAKTGGNYILYTAAILSLLVGSSLLSIIKLKDK